MTPSPEGGAKALPWALGALALIAAWMFYPERERQTEPAAWGAGGPRPPSARFQGRQFEQLTPKNQAFVRENYRGLLSAHERRDFREMFGRARNILSLVDDYNDTRSYEAIAKRGLDGQEEAKRQQQLDLVRARIREEVALLEKAGHEVAARGFKDPGNREVMDQLVKEIYTKDPNNSLAAQWQREARQGLAEENRSKQLHQLAGLEIKGQGLLKKARRSPASRAELYKVMDEIRSIEPKNIFVDEWKKQLLKD